MLLGCRCQVIDIRNPNTVAVEYRVHYAGWNTRYDEWIKCDAIISVVDAPSADVAAAAASKQKQPSSAVSVVSSSFSRDILCIFSASCYHSVVI